MLLPEHKFTIANISTEHSSRSGNSYRELLLKKSAPTDEFGDPIGKDDVLRVVVYEKHLDKLAGLKEGDKVLAQLYMNCEEKVDKQGNVFYPVNFSIRQIKQFTPETRKQ
jgi:hypothetical protein